MLKISKLTQGLNKNLEVKTSHDEKLINRKSLGLTLPRYERDSADFERDFSNRSSRKLETGHKPHL